MRVRVCDLSFRNSEVSLRVYSMTVVYVRKTVNQRTVEDSCLLISNGSKRMRVKLLLRPYLIFRSSWPIHRTDLRTTVSGRQLPFDSVLTKRILRWKFLTVCKDFHKNVLEYSTCGTLWFFFFYWFTFRVTLVSNTHRHTCRSHTHVYTFIGVCVDTSSFHLSNSYNRTLSLL